MKKTKDTIKYKKDKHKQEKSSQCMHGSIEDKVFQNLAIQCFQ